ncbi:enoyl-CoA delta isomerase 2 isoform X2 [Xenopus laevis]|nr:enoyl-CoA delta isomerase 2 isoform X2 [Xenopus laevis]XP_041422206.1 enoyl-CoA delta isomerase 2 isoform X2 [Xenopus laevis]XP_041422207.1 enoyl-CoA delta isomerase 2 isoform X2 [Xenopus laevis]XP_041422208.1 enoyl-CoA delta isomerase 2 isoform X2 [Xenopus laevis]
MINSEHFPKCHGTNSCGLFPKKNVKVKPTSTLLSSRVSKQANAVHNSTQQKFETLRITHQDGITTIIMNRPQRKNAFSLQMFNELELALDDAAADNSVFTVLTGAGDYFTSGNDLNNALENHAEEKRFDLRCFVRKFIDFPKPLVAVVNGPAVGIGATILGLTDLVYASDKATFNTPFIKLGLCPEACSSYTFPKIMGFTKATEVLLFNKILTAQEACSLGLVTEVFPDSTFQQDVWARLKDYASLPKNCLAYSKQLIRGLEREKLYAACDEECDLLDKAVTSEEAMNAIIQFFKKKSRL